MLKQVKSALMGADVYGDNAPYPARARSTDWQTHGEGSYPAQSNSQMDIAQARSQARLQARSQTQSAGAKRLSSLNPVAWLLSIGEYDEKRTR